MRVLIIADPFFAMRERTLLSRLEVGLADEGVRVVHAVPDSLPAALSGEVQGQVFSKTIRYRPARLRLARHAVAQRMIETLRAMDADAPGERPERAVDVVHVFGGSSWGLGADLANQLNAALALEVWRAGLVEQGASMRARHGRPTTLFAPDPAIERALRAAGASPRVALAPWGVHASPLEREILPENKSRCIVIVGSGRDARAFATALEGIARASRQIPDARIFCDAHAARRAGLWSLAKKLNITDRFSLIEEIEARRDILLFADVLVQPDAHGEQRSIVLDAFAQGMLVVAMLDPMVSVLTDSQTARLVKSPDPTEWATVVIDVLTRRDASIKIAHQANEFARTQRRVSQHVKNVLDAYAAMDVKPVAAT